MRSSGVFPNAGAGASAGSGASRAKRGSSDGAADRVRLADNFGGSYCLDAFDVSLKSIIRTNDSLDLGADFLGEEDVKTFETCLKLCCQTRLCDVAVWDENLGSCFMFDCGSPEDFRCLFDPNDNYVTGALEIDRHKFEVGMSYVPTGLFWSSVRIPLR